MNANFPESILQWCTLITKYSIEQNVDPNLIGALMMQESGGDPNARSKADAIGLLQIMPSDGLGASYGVFENRPTMEELYDPEFNIQFGVRYLSGLINYWGSEREALFHYGPLYVGYEGYADKILNIRYNMTN
jgi:soluble lytic murein transglycosylase-like protein